MGFCGVPNSCQLIFIWIAYITRTTLSCLSSWSLMCHFTLLSLWWGTFVRSRENQSLSDKAFWLLLPLLTKILLTLRKWAIIMPVHMRPLCSGADRWLAIFSTRGFRLIQTRFTWFVWSKHNNDVRGLALWTLYITWGLKLTTELTGFSAFTMHPFFRTFLPTRWFTCFACGR